MSVAVSVLLNRKDAEIQTLETDATVSEAAQQLADANVGSVLIVQPDGALAGLISERDIVHAVAVKGHRALDLPVSEIMISDVQTCTPETRTADLMKLMTEKRVRHVPVVDVVGGTRLVGIVSVGDVVKWQMDELATEAQQLGAYVTGSSY